MCTKPQSLRPSATRRAACIAEAASKNILSSVITNVNGPSLSDAAVPPSTYNCFNHFYSTRRQFLRLYSGDIVVRYQNNKNNGTSKSIIRRRGAASRVNDFQNLVNILMLHSMCPKLGKNISNLREFKSATAQSHSAALV